MGLSNPDRASATSIYTHVARLFIPRYPHALHVLSAGACPFSLSIQPAVRVHSALSIQPPSTRRTLVSVPAHCTSCQLQQCVSIQPAFSAPHQPHALHVLSARSACPFSPVLSARYPHALHVLSARIACPVSSLSPRIACPVSSCMSYQLRIACPVS
jgi:hypothetical protein